MGKLRYGNGGGLLIKYLLNNYYVLDILLETKGKKINSFSLIVELTCKPIISI